MREVGASENYKMVTLATMGHASKHHLLEWATLVVGLLIITPT